MAENNEKDLKRTEIEDNEAGQVAGGMQMFDTDQEASKIGIVKSLAGGALVGSSGRAMATVGSAVQKSIGETFEDNADNAIVN